MRIRRGAILLVILMSGLPALTGTASARSSDALQRVVVVLDDSVAAPGEVAALHSRSFGARIGHVYESLGGYSASVPAGAVRALRLDPLVASVERDQILGIVHHRPGHGGGGGGGDGGGDGGTACPGTQQIPWGIARVGADVSSTKTGDCQGAVSNVNVYVIDTGVDGGHADLNVVGHVNFAGGPNRDCNGHGTHVAGTAAARDNTQGVVGVSPGAPVTGVKVLGCGGMGWTSDIIRGVEWVTANAARPAVANMSIGGGTSDALDLAVKVSADSGILYAVAAGNDGRDACSSSPARAGTHAGVITTAATSSSDQEPSWSNFGSCVDVWAPGVGILSTASGGGTTTMSGTSMASPHVAGTAALYLSGNTGASASAVESALKSGAQATGTSSKDARPIALVYAGGY